MQYHKIKAIRVKSKHHLHECHDKTVCGRGASGPYYVWFSVKVFMSQHVDKRCRTCEKLIHKSWDCGVDHD